jgi:cyclophilin family peptidyl-prolyl cis-trans isomerase
MPAARHTRITVAAFTIALLMVACGSSADTAGSQPAVGTADNGGVQATTTGEAGAETTLTASPPSGYAEFAAQQTACGATAPDPPTEMSFPSPDDQQLDPATPVTATITTSCGEVVVELDPELAPATVNSFVFLARSGYFDGTVSHRVYPGFVIQAGDPTATGMGGPGYTLPDELPGAGFAYERGTVAMANAGPNSGGSQFFIVLADVGLNPDFSVFGKVVDGFDTLDRIAAVPLGQNPFGEVSVPLETVYLEKVTIDG